MCRLALRAAPWLVVFVVMLASCSLIRDTDRFSGDTDPQDASSGGTSGAAGSQASGGSWAGGSAGSGDSGPGGGGGSAGASGATAGAAAVDASDPGCPGGHLPLVDDFNDNQIGPEWEVYEYGATSVEASNGVVTLLVPAGTLAGYHASIWSAQAYDATNCSTFVRVLSATSTTDTYFDFGLSLETGAYVEFGIHAGNLIAQYGDPLFTIKSVPFDSTTYGWLRLREQGGMIHWETSSDGQTWTLFEKVPTPSWITGAHTYAGVYTWFGLTGATTQNGAAIFDDFNVTPP